MIVVFPLSIRHTSEPVERHSLTTIVFQLTSEQSHVEWRKTLQKEKCVQELKLYIGVHKLSLTDTQIIGFIDQKLPEVTHINHYEALLQSKLSAAAPEFVIERILSKTTSGFDVYLEYEHTSLKQ
jgi:hypothetical protein